MSKQRSLAFKPFDAPFLLGRTGGPDPATQPMWIVDALHGGSGAAMFTPIDAAGVFRCFQILFVSRKDNRHGLCLGVFFDN